MNEETFEDLNPEKNIDQVIKFDIEKPADIFEQPTASDDQLHIRKLQIELSARKFTGKLKLAAWVLIVLAVFLFSTLTVRIIFPNSCTDDVYEFIIQFVPPLVTLVLGYFFGAKEL